MRDLWQGIKSKRCVIKIGSSLLATNSPSFLNVRRMSNYVSQIVKLIEAGWEVILISSGAVAAGMYILGLKNRPTNMAILQGCAAVGQVVLMKKYARLFHYRKRHCAQVLLTADDLRTRERYINAKRTIDELLGRGIVPIVNENDTVSTEEIAVGDNDRLSAMVAGCSQAKLLVILSDVDGLYEDVKTKRLVSFVEKIDDRIWDLVKPKSGRTTVGGMRSKIQAAELAGRWGIPTIIASGHKKDILVDLLINKLIKGTVFFPPKNRIKSRKVWIAYIAKPRGVIYIDAGAYNAIRSFGKSLLCAGITKVDGLFDEGDVVRIFYNDMEVARGIVGMSSYDMISYMGKRAKKEAIHRNDLVLIEKEGEEDYGGEI